MSRVINASNDETPIHTARRNYTTLTENKFRRDMHKQQQEQELAKFKNAITSFLIPIGFLISAVVLAYFLT